MVNKLLGKKLGMTRYFADQGKSVPVTVLSIGPCVVIQKKTRQRDGYDAIQIGYEPRKENRVNKPLRGHFRAVGGRCFAHLKEIPVENPETFELGQEIRTDIFQPGDLVHVSGLSKGKGFAGVTKRWGFSGGKDTHGCRSHRVPGSIGASATPGRVVKGKKLPGRKGFERVTVRNLKVIDVRPDTDVLVVKGAVPGASNSVVEIRKA